MALQTICPSLGLPVSVFAEYLAQDARISEILEHRQAEAHGPVWRQQDWNNNRAQVFSHLQGLIATEMDNPLRTAASIEAAGLVEVVYPGLEHLTMPSGFKSLLSPNEAALNYLIGAWPHFLAAVLDTVRSDRAVDWSAPAENRTWNGESPLYGRWTTRTKNGWSARRFVGEDNRTHPQMRLWFARRVLRASGADESLAVKMLETSFDQLHATAPEQHWPWLKTERNHELSLGSSVEAFQILFHHLRLRKPATLFRCPDTATLWPRTVIG